MEAPTLSKKQQKQSLAAKKTKTRETIKNVLSRPYTSYWPQMMTEQENSVRSTLEANLPYIKEKRISPPFKEIKHLSKEERRVYRSEYKSKILPDEKTVTPNPGIIFGTNAVTKRLEKNHQEISIVLIKENVNTRLLVQHVIDMCVLYKVPFLLMKDLDRLTSEVCGVRTVCCAIKTDIPAESKLRLVRDEVVKVFGQLPPPINHVNYNRSRTLEDKLSTNIDAEPVEKKIMPELVKINEEVIRQSVYLKRKDKTERVFIPPDTSEMSKAKKSNVIGDFLSLSVEQDGNIEYIPLVVSRIKGDTNRKKRKIDSVK